jgi:hypothetical protein
MLDPKSCKATIQDGARKGQSCIYAIAIDQDGYCTRHQRQKEYDTLMAQGKRLCRKFFRGCNSEIQEGEKTCKSCLGLSKKAKCEHTNKEGIQCTYEVLNTTSKYCGKHQRDSYRDYEKKENVKLCNIERGCMNICDPEFLSCKSCIINNYIGNGRYYSEDMDNKLTCIVCEALYESSTLCDALKRCEQCCTDFMLSQKNKKVIQRRLYRDMPISSYYESYVKGAYSRTKEIDFRLSLSEFISLIKQPCYYCTTETDNDFMGIDRVDNNGDYSLENCVTCCTTCNRMKYSYSVQEFVNKCVAIHTHFSDGVSVTNKLWDVFPSFKTLSTLYYSDYKENCINKTRRDIEFSIEKDEFNRIKTGPCYLCGVKNTDDHYNGIDRIDNSKGYTLANCRACCGHCNILKGPIPIGIVKYYVAKIATNTNLGKYIRTIEQTDEDSPLTESDLESIKECEDRFATKRISELFDSSFDAVQNYCESHNRSNTFIRKVQNLYETRTEYSKDEIQLKLVRLVNAEHGKKHKETVSETSKKHMKANDVLTMLEMNQMDEYIEWHAANIGPKSSLFRKELELLVEKLPRLTANEKIIECKNILRKEHNRRNYTRTSEKVKAKIPTLQTSVIETMPSITKDFQAVDVHTIMPLKPNVIEHVPYIPKQWKTRDIYEFMKKDQEHYYKQYCEEHNDLSLFPSWSDMWSDFVLDTKRQTWEIAESKIREFIEELRKKRQLCSRKRNQARNDITETPTHP